MAEPSETEQRILSIPELSTRPLAVAAMTGNQRMRRWIERVNHDLMGVATRLAGHPIGPRLLILLWHEQRLEFHKVWNLRIENAVFMQCHGTMRNIYLNALLRVSGIRPAFRSQDIERRVPDRIRSCWVGQEGT